MKWTYIFDILKKRRNQRNTVWTVFMICLHVHPKEFGYISGCRWKQLKVNFVLFYATRAIVRTEKTPKPKFYDMNTAGLYSITCRSSLFENSAESRIVTFCISILPSLTDIFEFIVLFSKLFFIIVSETYFSLTYNC